MRNLCLIPVLSVPLPCAGHPFFGGIPIKASPFLGNSHQGPSPPCPLSQECPAQLLPPLPGLSSGSGSRSRKTWIATATSHAWLEVPAPSQLFGGCRGEGAASALPGEERVRIPVPVGRKSPGIWSSGSGTGWDFRMGSWHLGGRWWLDPKSLESQSLGI